MKKSHPLYITDSFITDGTYFSPYSVNYSVDGLAKLFMYGSYLKTKVAVENKTIRDILLQELKNYPYSRKQQFKVLCLQVRRMIFNRCNFRTTCMTCVVLSSLFQMIPVIEQNKYFCSPGAFLCTFSLQEPYFSPLDLSSDPHEFHSAITDTGICMVYNGNTMNATFKPSPRVIQLHDAIDARKSFQPVITNGTGKIYEKTFWLDVGDRHAPITKSQTR